MTDHLPLHHLVKTYHKEAFDCISTALQIDEDENGNKADALTWYTKGISILNKGVNVSTMGASAEDKEKIIRLQTKMSKNLEMAKDRQKTLSETSAPKVTKKVHRPKSGDKNTAVSSKTFKLNSTPHQPKPVKPTRPLRPLSARDASSPKPTIYSPRRYNGNDPQTSKTASAKSKLTSKRLKSVPSDLAKKIMDTAVEEGENNVKFSDIAGQQTAKEALEEIVILPALRPDLFSGLRTPAKGLLLFGPPGNGKTLLAKAVASEAKSVFFNISAATLTSKWVGEGEKMVKALFAVAREVQPSIVFIDEIDSLLRARQEGENDSARRLQNEFFLQFDGVGSDPNDRVLVMGATNRPHELDDAALRRFPKRIYVRLPDATTRVDLFQLLLAKLDHPLKKSEIVALSAKCDKYSFSDLTDLAKDAAMGPIREIPKNLFTSIDAKKMRKIGMKDFEQSLKKIRPSVSLELLKVYEEWNEKHGDVTGV